MKRSGKWEIGMDGENGSNPVTVPSPAGWVKGLALGLTVTLLFSEGLYVSISGLVIVFLELVL